ncbi:MAG TPA: murein L,D-transpeptidase catalytic domain family protein, partial [Thermoanaerobaculia bacterium]
MLGFSTPDVASTPAGRPLVKRLRRSSILPIALLLAAGLTDTSAFAAPTAPEAEGNAAIVPAVFAQRAEGLSPKVLATALDAVADARARGISGRSDRLTVIDYSLPSTEPRLWVLDLAKGKVLFHELVAHGAGSGDKFATHFSNVNESRATSLGLFLTGDTYEGGNGYSLKLKGLDAGVNDLAEMRKIVIHGAWYVSNDHSRQFGMIGRSWGCPAIPLQDAQPVIDAIKGGTFVYSYAASSAPTVQHAAFQTAAAKAPRAVAASYTTSSRSRHGARTR